MNGNVKIRNQPEAMPAVDPVEFIYVIQADDTVEAVTTNATYFQHADIFPAKAVVAGVLTANTLGDVYVGRSATYLPFKRATTDVANPVQFRLPLGEKQLATQIRVRGKAGDGVFVSLQP